MRDEVRFIESRKVIPVDISHLPKTKYIDILDVSGTALTRRSWDRILHGPVTGGPLAMRVLLLDPLGDCIDAGTASSMLWWDDSSSLRKKIEETSDHLFVICQHRGIELEVRHYDRLPVSRYVSTMDKVYQSTYPGPLDDDPVPVAVLRPDTVLGTRARREFDVLWAAARPSRHVAATAASPGPTPGPTWHGLANAPLGYLDSVPLVPHRKAVPADLASRLTGTVRAVDVIDVAGAAQVTDEWRDMLRNEGDGDEVVMRVLLLDPEGKAATARARESTRWQGDDQGLRAKIRRNIERLYTLTPSHVRLTVRVYDELPISRYVRVDDIAYQSVYPPDLSAKSIPLAVLDSASMLGRRAAREFEALWQTRSCPADPQPRIPQTESIVPG